MENKFLADRRPVKRRGRFFERGLGFIRYGRRLSVERCQVHRLVSRGEKGIVRFLISGSGIGGSVWPAWLIDRGVRDVASVR